MKRTVSILAMLAAIAWLAAPARADTAWGFSIGVSSGGSSHGYHSTYVAPVYSPAVVGVHPVYCSPGCALLHTHHWRPTIYHPRSAYLYSYAYPSYYSYSTYGYPAYGYSSYGYSGYGYDPIHYYTYPRTSFYFSYSSSPRYYDHYGYPYGSYWSPVVLRPRARFHDDDRSRPQRVDDDLRDRVATPRSLAPRATNATNSVTRAPIVAGNVTDRDRTVIGSRVDRSAVSRIQSSNTIDRGAILYNDPRTETLRTERLSRARSPRPTELNTRTRRTPISPTSISTIDRSGPSRSLGSSSISRSSTSSRWSLNPGSMFSRSSDSSGSALRGSIGSGSRSISRPASSGSVGRSISRPSSSVSRSASPARAARSVGRR